MQVIRLPKPRPGDWPVRPRAKGKGMQRFAAPAAAEEEEEDFNGEDSKGECMSAAHHTGLAKLPSVVEWVMHALGCTQSGQQEAKHQVRASRVRC